MNTIIFTLCIFAVIFTNNRAIGQRIPITDNLYGGLADTNSGGVQATLGTTGQLYHNEATGQRLDGHAQVSKHFQPIGPTQYGAGLEYSAPKVGATVDVQHAQPWGTHVNVAGRANVFESRDHRTRVDATANYGQNFGPRSRPDVGAGVRFTHIF